MSEQNLRSMSRPSRALGLLGGGSLLAATAGAGLGALLVTAGPAGAATYTVSSLDDNGAGTLRQAIADANASPGADVIDFAPGLAGTITLTTGKIVVTDDFTISGPGSAVLAVSGNNTSQIFYIYSDDSVVESTITGLTLTEGSDENPATGYGGGAIAAWSSNLTLNDVHITNSVTNGKGGAVLVARAASALGRDASFTMSNSVISGNSAQGVGGAIALYIVGGATITNSVIEDNDSYAGGGLAVQQRGDMPPLDADPVVIANSRFSSNTATTAGGAIWTLNTANSQDLFLDRVSLIENSAVYGGGVYVAENSDNVLILSSTVSGNTGGGVFSGAALTAIGYSTLSDNIGNGLEVGSGELEIEHTILSGGTLALASPATVSWSVVQTGSTNVISGSNNLLGTDPALLPLLQFSNTAWVRPIETTSPAFNAGDPAFVAPPEVDQTGRTRVAFGRIDIGAFEAQAMDPDPVVPTFTG